MFFCCVYKGEQLLAACLYKCAGRVFAQSWSSALGLVQALAASCPEYQSLYNRESLYRKEFASVGMVYLGLVAFSQFLFQS